MWCLPPYLLIEMLLASTLAFAAVTTVAALVARAGYPLPRQGTRLGQIDGLGGCSARRSVSTHENNFTLLRLLAAALVILAHSYDLQGQHDWLYRLSGQTFGQAGVRMFFVMSGFLIMQSLDRSPDLVRFAQARVLRIVPGLAVMLLVTVCALGAFATSVSFPVFLSDPKTLSFFTNAGVFWPQYSLPYVFEANLHAGKV